MRRILLALLAIAPSLALAQTQTTYTGTVKDLTGTTVTSGRITFTLNAPSGGNIPGIGSFVSTTVSCLINASGAPVSASDGTSPCTVINNTALTPTGTSYKLCFQPYNVTPGSCYNTFALGGSVDISTIIPTPATQPNSGAASVNGVNSWSGLQTFNGGLQSTTGLFSGGLAGTTLSLSGAATAQSVNGVWGVRCLGTEDTAQFNSVATLAGAAASASNIQTISVSGNCLVGGQVTAPSNVHWLGSGGTITVPTQTGTCHYTFLATNADNVAWDGLNIKVTTSPGGNNACYNVIQWIDSGSDSTAHAHVAIRNNTISNSVWGVHVQYAHGTGSLTDVDISGNTIQSPSGSYTNADGIHVGGRVSQISIVGNRVSNRNDAGIALTSEGSGTYVISGATIASNVLTEDRVGLDCSGCTNANFTGNNVKATIAAGGTSNPACREIYYNGYPANVRWTGNYFENPASSEASVCKIDPLLASQVSWPSINSTFSGNTIGGTSGVLYARGNGISISDNTFLTSGGGIVLDYDGADSVATANVTIGPNRWQSSGVVTFGAGCALYSGISYYPQQTLGALTVSNLSCIGAQAFVTPSDVQLGGNLTAPGTSPVQIVPGTGSFDFVVRNHANSANHFIIDSSGNGNFPVGTLTANSYMQATGFITPGCGAGTFQKADTAGCAVPAGGGPGAGTVTNVSTGNLSPLFTAAIANPASTPALSFTLSSAAQNAFLAGPTSGAGAPTYRAIVAADVPTLNQNTTGTAGGLTGTPAIVVSTAKATTFYTNLDFCVNGGSWPSCTACTTAATIDPANGNNQTIILTNAQTCALTFTQPVSKEVAIQLTVIQSSAGSFNGLISGCTWPGGAGGGVAPTITPASGAVDVVWVKLDSSHTRCTIGQAFN